MNFGNITLETKKKYLSTEHVETVLYRKDGPGDYYLFLLEGKPKFKDDLTTLCKDIEANGYKNYIVATATTRPFNRDDISKITEYMLSVQSNWKDYIVKDGQRAKAIMAFGCALYTINHSADIETDAFMDYVFDKTYYYVGTEFLGDIGTFIFPVHSIDNIYYRRSSAKIPDVIYKTKFFRKQLKLMQGDKILPSDMRPYKIHITSNNQDTNSRIKRPTSDETLEKLMNSELLAWDLETSGLDPKTNKIGCLTLCNDGVNGYYVPWSDIQESPKTRKLFLQCLYSAKHTVGANIKFDIHNVWNTLGDDFDLWSLQELEDVIQLSHAIHSERKKGLKSLALYYTPFGGYDDELDVFKKQTRVDSYIKIPINILSKYATLDAIVTWRVWHALVEHCNYIDSKFPNEKPLEDWSIFRWYNDLMKPVYKDFLYAEHQGMYVDIEYQAKVREKLFELIDKQKEKLAEIWGVDKSFQFESTDKLGKLFEKLGWPAIEINKKGLYATSEFCLLEWQKMGKPGIQELMTLREYNTYLNGFIGVPGEDRESSSGWEQYLFKEKDGSYCVHQSYGVCGTSTYRHNCHEPNLQNIPTHGKFAPEIKRCVTPKYTYRYTLEDENGNKYVGGQLDKIDVIDIFGNRVTRTLDQVQENDTIVENSFVKYTNEYDKYYA